MRALYIVILVISSNIFAFSQKKLAFDEKIYPTEKFSLRKEETKLGDLSVEIVHVRPKDHSYNPFMCRAWLRIKKEGKVINELFADINPVGGCGGFYFPEEQPLKNYILASKFGDYEGRILIIDKNGELKNYGGGTFCLSSDKKILLSNHNSDLSGTTIIDLSKNELIFTGELDQYVSGWYYQEGKYYLSIYNQDTNAEKSYFLFDFSTKKFINKIIKGGISKANKLTTLNDPYSQDCSCGK